jgi:hypothetical protein
LGLTLLFIVGGNPHFKRIHIPFFPDETTEEAASRAILFLGRISAVLTGDYFRQNIKINLSADPHASPWQPHHVGC